MKQTARKITGLTIRNATIMATRRITDIRNSLERVDIDPDKTKRIERWECKVCHYLRSRVGGAAITFVDCAICGVEMIFGSTATNIVCIDCGKKNGLCCCCGCDIDFRLKTNREVAEWTAK